MKLLGWMHRKLRQQNSLEPFKEFTSGNPCFYLSEQQSLDNQQYYPNPTYHSAYPWQPQGKVQKFTGELKNKRVEEDFEEESAFMISDDFNGFLTIGTLGSETIITEPPTPTFPMLLNDKKEKETEVTENELKLVNDELEKFLEAEAEEVCSITSGRSSHASTITLSGKQIKGVETEDYGDMVLFPLQEYLFASSIELPETSIEGKKEKTSLGQLFNWNNTGEKEKTSLGQLYNCNNTGEEHAIETCETQAKEKHAVHFMKKMMKKLHSSSRSSAASNGGEVAGSTSTKRKLPKVLRMFHKKVHPERATEKDFTESDTGNLTLQDKDNRKSLLGALLKKDPTSWNISYNRFRKGHSTQNKERWIKTDADYLVLEL